MTIEQVVEIPADRRITVELPPDIPTGTARLKLSVSHNGGTAEKTGKISRQMRKLLQLYGCLKDSPVFEGDPVAIQREMRAENDDLAYPPDFPSWLKGAVSPDLYKKGKINGDIIGPFGEEWEKS
jgi:hypothetical protein